MNVFCNGSVAFSDFLQWICCFYFCAHYHRCFEKKQSVTQVSFLINEKNNKIFAYCQKCWREIRGFYLSCLPNRIGVFFKRQKKNHITAHSCCKILTWYVCIFAMRRIWQPKLNKYLKNIVAFSLLTINIWASFCLLLLTEKSPSASGWKILL